VTVRTKKHTRSFAAGVITPELHGRLDLTKFQTGLAEAINFWVLPHGPVQNRPGTTFVNEVKDSTKKVRIEEFSFSTTQTYVIEFGDQYIRWHTNGSTLLEASQAITGITQANPGVLTYAGADPSNGDWMFLTGIGGMTQLNSRYVKVANVNAGANTFELTDMAGANINTTSYGAYTSGGTMARVYQIASPYVEADLFDLHFTQSADVLTIVHPNHAPRELKRLAAASWTLTSIAFAPTIAAPGAPTTTPGGPGGGAPIDHTYVCTALAEDTLEESLASASDTENRDLTVAGNFIDVDPPAVAGAVRYNIYKLFNGLYGYVGQTDGSALRDNNITPDVSKTPPIASTPFGSSSNYPGAVGYVEGRRAFAGTDNKPQNYWLTRSATESNLSYSIPTRDDDAITGRILASQVNRIRHILTVGHLIFLTSGGEWKVAPQNSDILTPDSAAPKQDWTEGASNVMPVIAGGSVLYAQDEGGRVVELKYQRNQDGTTAGYSVNDISILAPHFFDDYTIADMAFKKSPHKMVFSVRSDGRLLGLTYLPEHDVVAWHEHTTSGTFESVAAVREGTERALYAVVKRSVNGRDVRYIERLHTRKFTDQEDAYFVDCGATYDGVPITSITNGLWHLEGKTVKVVADGAVHPSVTVTNGTITLEYAASVIHVGLGYTADFQTLPLAVEADSAFGQGALKNVNQLHLRVRESSGIKAGPTYGSLREYKQRTTEPYDSPPALKNGTISLSIDPMWGQEGQVCVRQDQPLPLTILSMTLEAAVGG
jgi:hypothetical protein